MKNYGDVDFFDYGVLVEEMRENEYRVVKCQCNCDEENNYLLQDDVIDITDSWIDKDDVCSYIGLRGYSIDYTEEEKLQLAIGVLDYYGEQSSTGGSFMTKNEVIDYVTKRYEIEEEDFYIRNFDDDCRNVVAEICYHTGSRVTIVKDTIEEAIEYFTDYLEEGDSIEIISK